MDIAKLLKQMDRAVQRDRKGELLLGWRIRLWSAMKADYGREAALRRNILAFVVAQEVYPHWKNGRIVSAIEPEDADVYMLLDCSSEIMTVVEWLRDHPEVEHGPIRIASGHLILDSLRKKDEQIWKK